MSMIDDKDLPTDRGDEVNTDDEPKTKGAAADADDAPAGKTGDNLDPEDELETPEEKAAREKEEAEAEAKKRIRIPKSRFDEAQAKARAREAALQAELNTLKQAQRGAATQGVVAEHRAKIEELQDKYEDLILDGKKEDAKRVRRQVDAMREELLEYQTSTKADSARRQAIEELSYNAKLANFEAAHPMLNPDSDEFDEEKTGEVATLLKAFITSGMNRSEALSKAVKYALGDMSGREAGKVRDEAQRRAEAARRKAAEASGKQPPSTTKVGLNSDRAGQQGDQSVDVMRLSQDKFAKLDEATLAKLRGDEV